MSFRCTAQSVVFRMTRLTNYNIIQLWPLKIQLPVCLSNPDHHFPMFSYVFQRFPTFSHVFPCFPMFFHVFSMFFLCFSMFSSVFPMFLISAPLEKHHSAMAVLGGRLTEAGECHGLSKSLASGQGGVSGQGRNIT